MDGFRCLVFGEPRTGVRGCGCRRAPVALPAASIAGLEQRGGDVADSWSHAKPRSREGKLTGGWFGVVNGVILLAVL